MSTELRTFALNSTLNEIKLACPEISHSLIFDENWKILARDEDTNKLNAVQTACLLSALVEKAEAIGGIDSITFQTDKGHVNVFSTNSLRTVIVASKKSDDKLATTLHCVLIPTVLGLVEKCSQESAKNFSTETGQKTVTEEPDEVNEPAMTEQPDEETPDEETISIEDELDSEPSYPEPMATQFMIETIGGLLVSSDTVQIDNAAILQWNETYEGKEINEVEIETLSGQTVRCKFKPIKDARRSGKGVIRIPKKVQLVLQSSEGELVTVKPVLN